MRGLHGQAGDAWTWTAIDADTKLVLSCLVGGRDAGYAHEFMQDVASRLKCRVQLATDGHKAYLSVVEDASVRRVHQMLRVTPAMEAGVSDHMWSVEEIVALLGQ